MPSIEKKVLFFGIKQAEREYGQEERAFEDSCKVVMQLDPTERRYKIPQAGPDEFLRLTSFEKPSENASYYAGTFVKYRSGNMTVGTEKEDSLTDHQLEAGLHPTEITHFIYHPDTHVLSIVYNHSGPKHLQLVKYVNFYQQTADLDPVNYQVEVLYHPDVLSELNRAEYIKTFEIAIPRYEIPNDIQSGDIFKALLAAANIGRPGRVAVKVFGPAKRGDRSPLMTGRELIEKLDNDSIDLGIFGTAKVEAMMEYGMDTINLLQNDIDSTIQMPSNNQVENAGEIYSNLHSVYVVNREMLMVAMGASNA